MGIGIRIVVADVDGLVFKEKRADDVFISRFRKDVDLSAGHEDVLVDIVAEAVIGTAFC